ncbi:NAD(P)-dependent alcohol dehydrogenase [Kineococcus indalonis]|uniref:NAD(P)-dependent alcohol dehydrogenase n=1 Tax=Kineococcus indalonis TaxID=2696566 RepID=UPI001411C8DC|nr:NAD(P)-dependent alcohol dehydrogenase [Kineococcus indalonis]NAZ86166.1 alcohol dehydrogenase catalytic domain-containing protein [Kineococcus indalonis]
MSTTTVPATMRASVLVEQGVVELQERPVPTPAADEVLVRVASVGVCGSDVHYYKEGRIGDFVVEQPLVLGHEVSGQVVAAGRDVPQERVGERVAIDPQVPCRHCRACKSGRMNLCPNMRFYATPPVDGTFCDYVTAPADMAYPVPDVMSDDAAALLEPFSVGLWAAHKAGTTPGDRVLVAGAGPIGAMVAQAVRARGAADVVVTDFVDSRRERIASFGATRTLHPVDDADEIAALGADAFVDCSGATPAVRSGIAALRPGGAAVLVGLGAEEMPLPVTLIASREITVTGVFRYVDTWPRGIELFTSGAVHLDDMVTARYPLEQVEDALNADSDPLSMKAVVVVNPTTPEGALA